MKYSQACVDLVKSFEGLKLKAYKCPAGVLTIGYGTTKGVKPDWVITEFMAEAYLKRDLLEFEKAVNKIINAPLNQNQFDALVSFCYNIGAGAFEKSTLARLINQGHYSKAAEQFLRWNKSNGKILKGLTRRREAERKLFLTEQT
jgi:lysozyme